MPYHKRTCWLIPSYPYFSTLILPSSHRFNIQDIYYTMSIRTNPIHLHKIQYSQTPSFVLDLFMNWGPLFGGVLQQYIPSYPHCTILPSYPHILSPLNGKNHQLNMIFTSHWIGQIQLSTGHRWPPGWQACLASLRCDPVRPPGWDLGCYTSHYYNPY